jgi:STAS-like domain of unknown function (DUF4325)
MITRIHIPPGANGFAEDKDEARNLRLSKLLPALERDEKVALDFSKVNYATQSYIHALIGEALQKFGDKLLDRVEFKNCSTSVRSVIELVVDYSLAGFPDQQAI